MAAAEISRPSWPYRPARDPGDRALAGRALPDRAQTDRGPAHEIIAEMASLLLDTRGSLLLGGMVLSTITDTWTYITAAYFLVGSGLILLGL
jgi:hypothetical protein